jgi:hypothetical protein
VVPGRVTGKTAAGKTKERFLIFLLIGASSSINCFPGKTVPEFIAYCARDDMENRILVPVANLIKLASGGWHLVFVLTAIMNFAVVGLALFVLKPSRERFVRSGQERWPTETSFAEASNATRTAAPR